VEERMACGEFLYLDGGSCAPRENAFLSFKCVGLAFAGVGTLARVL